MKTAAEEAVTVKTAEKTEISYNGDVNCTGTADINDAQLVYDIYNAKYGSFDTAVTMLKFLRADVNGDGSVDSNDAVRVVNIVYSKQ